MNSDNAPLWPPVIVIDEDAISPERRAELIRKIKEFSTRPAQIRTMYANRPQVHRVRATFLDAGKYCPPVPMGFIIPFAGDAIQVHDEVITPAKDYRVFYDCGVYEWYVNTGRAPLWHYRTRGELVGAYNVRAGICAPFAQLKNILK